MDSSTDLFHVAILKNGKLLYAAVRKSERNMTDFAVGEVSKAFEHCNVSAKDLTDIYVTTGPGSFTSVRVALVIAKTIISQFRHISLWHASTLLFQLGARRGLSIVNARSDSWYVAIRHEAGFEQFDKIMPASELEGLKAQHPSLPVFKDLQQQDFFADLADRLREFKKAEDYKQVVATYVKKAYGN